MNFFVDPDKKRQFLTRFFPRIVTLICLYQFVIEFVSRPYSHNSYTTLATAFLLLLFSVILFYYAFTSGLPWSFFGFQAPHLKRDLKESIIWSIYLCLFFLLGKFFLINYVGLFSDLNLFGTHRTSPLSVLCLHAVSYAVLTGLQTFIIQGFIQSSLFALDRDDLSTYQAISITMLIFAIIHIDLNIAYALIVIIPGLLWVILYARNHSLLGVYLSHAIIGVFAIYCLGAEEVLVRLSSLLI